MGEVVELPVLTTVDEPAEQILEKAKDWFLDDVLVIGWRDDGEFLIGGNMADLAQITFLLEKAKMWVMEKP